MGCDVFVRIINCHIHISFRDYVTEDSRAVINAHPGISFELNLPRSSLLFDGHPIIEAEGLSWKLADHDIDLKRERSTFDLQVFFYLILKNALTSIID